MMAGITTQRLENFSGVVRLIFQRYQATNLTEDTMAAAKKTKIDLAKEAEETSSVKIEGTVTEELLFEVCPPVVLKAFAKAKSAGARADLLKEVTELRLAKQKEAEVFDKFEKTLQRWFLENLTAETSGVSGKKYKVQLVKKQRPEVTDWTAFYAYIKRNSAFELLNKAVSKSGVSERWSQNKKIPGVIAFDYNAISVTKI